MKPIAAASAALLLVLAGCPSIPVVCPTALHLQVCHPLDVETIAPVAVPMRAPVEPPDIARPVPAIEPAVPVVEPAAPTPLVPALRTVMPAVQKPRPLHPGCMWTPGMGSGGAVGSACGCAEDWGGVWHTQRVLEPGLCGVPRD